MLHESKRAQLQLLAILAITFLIYVFPWFYKIMESRTIS